LAGLERQTAMNTRVASADDTLQVSICLSTLTAHFIHICATKLKAWMYADGSIFNRPPWRPYFLLPHSVLA
jgi:hypothetical protein